MNKRVAIAVVMMVAAAAAQVQFHGVPAGATSLSNTHTFSNPPGVPAGATSLTPRGFTSTRGVFVQQPVRDRRDVHRIRPIAIGVPVPLYGYSYGYYPYLNSSTEAEMSTSDYRVDEAPVPVANYSPQPIVVAPVQQPPQVIVIDNRGVHDATADEKEQALAASRAAQAQKQQEQQARSAAQQEPEDVGPMTVLVLRDGSRKEVKNYAIMGKELIVLGPGSLRRVQLADIDVPATQKENDVRGLDFKLP